MYKPPCRRRLTSRTTGTTPREVQLATEKSAGYETPLMVCVIPEPLRGHCARVATVNHQPGQLHLQVESCEKGFGKSCHHDQGTGVTMSDDLVTRAKDRGGVLDTMVSSEGCCVCTQ